MLKGLNPNIEVVEPFDPGIRQSVSVCLVSRKEIDPQILKTLEGFGEVLIGDGNQGVAGRYEAIAKAKFDIIYTQDDDCVVDIPALMLQWDNHFIANMRPNRVAEYPGNVTLIGWGAMFKKSLTDVLTRYTDRWGQDELFRRECDRVFTGLNSHKKVFVDVENLPSIAEPSRLSNDPRHWEYLETIRGRVRSLGGS